MSRILVVGIDGVDSRDGQADLGPSRRTRQFASAIADAGHEAVVLRLDRSRRGAVAKVQGGSSVGGRSIDVLSASMESFARGQGREILRAIPADAVVAATVHASSLAARAVADDVPLWVDVFGDPMAEAQAKAVIDGHDLALARYWEALVAAIDRGDHFSAVSNLQAHALIGQLGLTGRLTRASAGKDLVSVIPCGAERLADIGSDEILGTLLSREAFVVVFSGSFNTWCDVETMLLGVEAAMEAARDIHVVVTGGAVAGHDERTYERFCARLRASRHRGRVHVLGWVDRSLLASLYARADVGLNIERTLYERALGAENRVVEWMRHGIPAITTAASESGRDLVRRGLAFATPQEDPEALARLLIRLSRERDRVRAVGALCVEHAERECSYAVTARPLVEWCANPRRTPREGERRLRVALASEPQALSGLLEDYLAEIPPHRLAYRSVRWLWRRFARARRERDQRT
jgi:glycosyltransferase involved in cell wall biosynthesis